MSDERASFLAALEPHRARVQRVVATLVPEEAEDLVQEAFRLALEERERFRGDSRPGTWVCGIALNLCRRRLRDKQRHAVPQDPVTFDQAAARRHGVLTSIVRRELAATLDQAIAQLPDSMREAFVLHHLGELPYEEVGRLLEVSAATARVRAHRARALLREELGSAVDESWLSESGRSPEP